MQNEIRLQQLQNWKKSLELKKLLDEQGIDSQNKDYLAQLTYKIAEKAFGNQNKKNLEGKVCEMIEQQTCAICFELMVPPIQAPILLFPCGHTFCKKCVLIDGKLRIQKCSLCRGKINAHAVNLSLQNLICSFSEQKQQIPKQQEEIKVKEIVQDQSNNQYSTQYKMYKMRCEILEQEKLQLFENQKQLQNELNELEQQVLYIQQERENIQKKQVLLQQDLDGLNEVLVGIVNQSQSITLKLHETQEQIKILDVTLKPLLTETKKYELLSKTQ